MGNRGKLVSTPPQWCLLLLESYPKYSFQLAGDESVFLCRAPTGQRFAVRVATWLILPVVICLSQRLSHACLSINCLYCETANGSLNQL